MSHVAYDGDIQVDENPNDSGIYNLWQHFKVPKDAEGEIQTQCFDDYVRDAGAALGVAMTEAEVFKLVRPEDNPSLKKYETDLEKPMRMGVKVIPDRRVPDQKMKNLKEENSRLRSRVRDLEKKLAQVKESVPDEI
jgi:hypothetical protein